MRLNLIPTTGLVFGAWIRTCLVLCIIYLLSKVSMAHDSDVHVSIIFLTQPPSFYYTYYFYLLENLKKHNGSVVPNSHIDLLGWPFIHSTLFLFIVLIVI